MLGAGLVAGPAVELLSRCASRKVVVVSAVEGEAAALAATIGRPNIEARTMDCGGAADAASLVVEAIADASAALSLLPASMHGAVAAAGIAHGTPVVTASYISEELAAMGPAAEAAGVPVLGEMGLDPGMDHMSAMQLIDEAKAAGGASSASAQSAACVGPAGWTLGPAWQPLDFICPGRFATKIEVRPVMRCRCLVPPHRDCRHRTRRTTRCATSSRGRRGVFCLPRSTRRGGWRMGRSWRYAFVWLWLLGALGVSVQQQPTGSVVLLAFCLAGWLPAAPTRSPGVRSGRVSPPPHLTCWRARVGGALGFY